MLQILFVFVATFRKYLGSFVEEVFLISFHYTQLYIYIYTRVIGVDGLVTGSSLTIVLKIGSKSVYDISGSNCPYLSYDEGAAGWPAAPLM